MARAKKRLADRAEDAALIGAHHFDGRLSFVRGWLAGYRAAQRDARKVDRPPGHVAALRAMRQIKRKAAKPRYDGPRTVLQCFVLGCEGCVVCRKGGKR